MANGTFERRTGLPSGLRQVDEVALLEQPGHSSPPAPRPSKRVAERQLHVLETLPQVHAPAVHREDQHAETVAEVQRLQRAAD